MLFMEKATARTSLRPSPLSIDYRKTMLQLSKLSTVARAS